MEWILGVDGGGTSSRLVAFSAKAALAGDFSAPLARATGGPTNPNAVGAERLERNLGDLFRRALEDAEGEGAPLDPRSLVAACFATAGVGRPEDRAIAEGAASSVFGDPCSRLVVGDHEAALVGAVGGAVGAEEGIILISGTGSMAYARSRDGRSVRAGGLGHWLGDEGSAFAVAFQGLSRSLRSREGRDLPTDMLGALLAHLGLGSPEAAVPFVYARFDKATIASAAPVVQAARERGDPLASAIFKTAAEELVSLVLSVRDRAPFSTDGATVALWGGMFEKDLFFREEVVFGLRRTVPELVPILPRGGAAEGACRLAVSVINFNAR